jgi:hypothetical protein
MKSIYNDDYHKVCREHAKKYYCPKKKRIYHILKKYNFDKDKLEGLSVDDKLIELEKMVFEKKFNMKLVKD